MLEGIYAEGVFTQERVRPYLSQPAPNTAGVDLGSQSIFRYARHSSPYPTLTLVEPVYDNAGGVIRPGHYELVLSDLRDFLIIIESRQPRAVIPVFKLEEDNSKPPPYIQTKPSFGAKVWGFWRQTEPPLKTADKDYNEYNKETLKEKKLREVINGRRAKAGQQPDIPFVYTEASVEYVPQGDYYLLKYERGGLRAWGAFKG